MHLAVGATAPSLTSQIRSPSPHENPAGRDDCAHRLRRLVPACRDSLAAGTRPGNAINRNTDTEHTSVTGPAIDAAAVVADLHPLPGLVNSRHQVQVDRPGDTRQDDVADLELRQQAAGPASATRGPGRAETRRWLDIFGRWPIAAIIAGSAA